MRHCLHHLRWLRQRFRSVLLVYTGVWALLTLVVWLVPADGETLMFQSAPAILLAWAGIILLEVMWQDAGRGTDTFWRTRPLAWSALWLSQTMFLLLFLAGPPVLCWAVNGMMLGNTPAQWGYGTFDLLKILCPLAVLAGIASFSRGWYSLILVLVAAVACWGAGWLGMTEAYFNHDGMDNSRYAAVDNYLHSLRDLGSTRLLRLKVAWAGTVTLLMLLSWAWGLRRARVRPRAIAVGTLLLMMPLLVWWAVPEPAPPQTVLQAELPPAGGVTPPDFQRAGVLMLRGVPEDTVAIISQQFLRLRSGSRGEAKPLWGVPGGEAPDLTGREMHWSSEYHLGSTGKLMRALVPDGTHRYTDEPRFFAPPRDSRLFNQEGEPLAGRVTGRASGFLLSVAKLLSVPLEAGALAVENGVRLRIRAVELEDEIITVSLDIRQASCGEEAVPPDGFAGAGSGAVYAVPVLYFPSVPMALIVSKGGASGDFRSWQTRVQLQLQRLALPEAEVLRGVRFTPGVMRDARLILCAAVPRGTFNVTLPEGPQTLPGAPEQALRRRAASLFQSLDHPSYDGTSRSERLKRLKAMGGEAMRGILQQSWTNGTPPFARKNFNQLRPELRLEDFIPKLSEAIQRDPRWMNTAWFNGVADKVEDAALTVLRTRRQPLPVSVVAAVAVKAEPADYPALRNHVFNAVPLTILDKEFHGPLPGRVLWQRLRVLPGFDWRSPVREMWRTAFHESHPEDHESHPDDKVPDELREYAALAGDGEALNVLLERKTETRMDGGTLLTIAEWTELAGMIDGIPAEGEARDVWLREHRGYFTWDEAAGKYHVVPRGK